MLPSVKEMIDDSYGEDFLCAKVVHETGLRQSSSTRYGVEGERPAMPENVE